MKTAVMPMVALHVVHAGAYMQCATYLLVGPDGAVLIDPGSGCEETAVLANMAAAGVALADIRAMLITHCHVDHSMGALRLQRQGLRAYASAATAARMRRADPEIWGEHPECIRHVEVDGELTDGQRLQFAGLELLCVATPGHTAGCMSFLLTTPAPPPVPGGNGPAAPAANGGGAAPCRTLFTGDVVCDNGHPGWAGGPDFSAANTLNSVERLLALEPDLAWWGHGGPLTQPREWLRHAAELGRRGAWKLGTGCSYWDVPPALQCR